MVGHRAAVDTELPSELVQRTAVMVLVSYGLQLRKGSGDAGLASLGLAQHHLPWGSMRHGRLHAVHQPRWGSDVDDGSNAGPQTIVRAEWTEQGRRCIVDVGLVLALRVQPNRSEGVRLA